VYPDVGLAAVPPVPPAPTITSNDVDGIIKIEVAEI
jgi:hypothetical protein